ncbi:hypothetical protein [Streptomyces sp. NPDC090022]|uniref:hypothetical protein n=1 Tax=Streptomyces sp. NPDC090022 TaxID=3365920 RepID=UPI00382ADEC4
MTAPITGARTPAQLTDNPGASEVDFTASRLARLDESGAIDLGYPHTHLAGAFARTQTRGDLKIDARR